MMIARDGLPIILFGLAIALLALAGAILWTNWQTVTFAVIWLLLAGFSVYFFRDPERTVPDGAGVLVAPADGRVVAIVDGGAHLHVGQRTRRVSIFLSIFDVHVNRVPAGGTVSFVNYTPGQFLPAFKEKASADNEQTEIGMVTPEGQRYAFKQIAGLIARRIVCRLEAGQEGQTGQRMGIIRFGSRADLIVPENTDVVIREGQTVRGGETIIGYLPAAPGTSTRSLSRSEDNAQL
jgi:phosphatidylserine decarboxylase